MSDAEIRRLQRDNSPEGRRRLRATMERAGRGIDYQAIEAGLKSYGRTTKMLFQVINQVVRAKGYTSILVECFDTQVAAHVRNNYLRLCVRLGVPKERWSWVVFRSRLMGSGGWNSSYTYIYQDHYGRRSSPFDS